MEQQAGNLITQRFTAACGHDDHGIATGTDGVDNRLLRASKGRIAKSFLQNVLSGIGCHADLVPWVVAVALIIAANVDGGYTLY